MRWLPLALSTAKRWVLPLAISGIVVALGGSWWIGYQAGQSRAESAAAAALEVERQRQARLADELEQAQQERRVVYRDRVRYVDRVVDDCADVPAPDGVLDSLGFRRD